MKSIQPSDTIRVGAVLAASGGFMDAYSYLCRGKVFANAQTGNLLLFGVNLSEGRFNEATSYFAPIIAFVAGIIIAEIARYFIEQRRQTRKKLLHWRQAVLVAEMLCLIAVSFMPQNLNLLANSITSMACGMQVESFRKIHGNGIATTMCIGNLRSGTENLCKYIQNKNNEFAKKALIYYGAILCFIIGAVAGNLVIYYLHEKAILTSVFLLLVGFIMMFADEEANITDIK